jgi:uncharacterized membrane protein
MINPFKLISLYFADKRVVNEAITEAKKMDGAKPGWKTSTFWIKIMTVDLPVLYMGIKGFIPAKTAATIEVVAMGIYAIYRTVVGVSKQLQTIKSGTPATEINATTAVVSQ